MQYLNQWNTYKNSNTINRRIWKKNNFSFHMEVHVHTHTRIDKTILNNKKNSRKHL
jgi:hydroxyacyl-ACP dehydratase HTD2-like protein with hotdog domain